MTFNRDSSELVYILEIRRWLPVIKHKRL